MTTEIKSYTDSAINDVFKEFFNSSYNESKYYNRIIEIQNYLALGKNYVFDVDYDELPENIQEIISKLDKKQTHKAVHRADYEILLNRMGDGVVKLRKDGKIKIRILNLDGYGEIYDGVQDQKNKETKEPIFELSKLNEIDDKKYAGKKIKVKSVIASNSVSYNVPCEIIVKCSNNDERHVCVKERVYHIPEKDYVKFVEIPDFKKTKELQTKYTFEFGIKCNTSIRERDTTTVRKLRVRPVVSSLYKKSDNFFEDDGNEWSAYDVYVLQDEIQNLTAGKEIEIVGRVIPDPKNSKITMIVSEINYIDDNIFDVEKIKELINFCKGKTPDEIMEWYSSEFEKFSKIIKRKNVTVVGLLTFFSPLYINFGGSQIPAWLKNVIVGDSTTGKSETIRQLIVLLKQGQIVSGEMATVAGLAGASVQASGGQWFTDFGVLPLQDRKLLAIDGSHKLGKNELDKLAEAERNGRIEITKASKGDAYARTRQIKIQNPIDDAGNSDTVTMDSFLYPVNSLQNSFQIQSIARIDLACFVPNDVSASERNIDTTNWKHDPLLENLSELVKLTWSQNSMVEFSEDTINEILTQATRLETKFNFDELPLISNDQKQKIAKISSSLAYLTCSFSDDLKIVIVKKEHVEYASAFIDTEYTIAGLGELSTQTKHGDIDLELIFEIFNTIGIKIQRSDDEMIMDILTWLPNQKNFKREDLIEEFSLTRDKQANPLISYLKNEGIVKPMRNGYSVTKKGVAVTRFILNFDESGCKKGMLFLKELTNFRNHNVKTFNCTECNSEWKNTTRTKEQIQHEHGNHKIIENDTMNTCEKCNNLIKFCSCKI